jgi:hypothetical protein
MKRDLKYYILFIAYVLCVLSLEFIETAPTIILAFLLGIAIFISLVNIPLTWKRRPLRQNLILLTLLSLPFFSLAFGWTNKLRNHIKGDIVFTAFDNATVASFSFDIREKDGNLTGEFGSSVAGFGEKEGATVEILTDTSFAFLLDDRECVDTFDFSGGTAKTRVENRRYRILKNELKQLTPTPAIK